MNKHFAGYPCVTILRLYIYVKYLKYFYIDIIKIHKFCFIIGIHIYINIFGQIIIIEKKKLYFLSL